MHHHTTTTIPTDFANHIHMNSPGSNNNSSTLSQIDLQPGASTLLSQLARTQSALKDMKRERDEAVEQLRKHKKGDKSDSGSGGGSGGGSASGNAAGKSRRGRGRCVSAEAHLEGEPAGGGATDGDVHEDDRVGHGYGLQGGENDGTKIRAAGGLMYFSGHGSKRSNRPLDPSVGG